MLDDKRPIVWGRDSADLMMRKLARRPASSRLVLRCLESRVASLEAKGAPDVRLARLYRWVIGGYLYRGLRCGLAEAGQV